MVERITDDMVEAAARAMRPEWFTDDGSPPIVNNYPDQHVWIQEDARRAARVALEAVFPLLQHQPSLPVEAEGWVLVPTRPTPEMFESVLGWSISGPYLDSITANDIWETMLAAAPSTGGR